MNNLARTRKNQQKKDTHSDFLDHFGPYSIPLSPYNVFDLSTCLLYSFPILYYLPWYFSNHRKSYIQLLKERKNNFNVKKKLKLVFFFCLFSSAPVGGRCVTENKDIKCTQLLLFCFYLERLKRYGKKYLQILSGFFWKEMANRHSDGVFVSWGEEGQHSMGIGHHFFPFRPFICIVFIIRRERERIRPFSTRVTHSFSFGCHAVCVASKAELRFIDIFDAIVSCCETYGDCQWKWMNLQPLSTLYQLASSCRPSRFPRQQQQQKVSEWD